MSTNFSSDFTVSYWSTTTFEQGMERTFFVKRGMMGPSPSNIIQFITEVEKNPGDTVRFDLEMLLDGDGVVDDAQLLGNEESLVYYQDSITVRLLRNAVEEAGEMQQKKVIHNTRRRARPSLSKWWSRRFERMVIKHLIGDTSESFPATALAPSSNRLIVAGVSNTAVNSLESNTTDRFTVEEIARAKDLADTATVPLVPIQLDDGEPVFIMLLHPWQTYNLKYGGTGTISSAWREAQRTAMARGKDNPLFTGALGMWDNVILHTHQMIPTMTNASSVNYANAVLLGQQALGVAYGSSPRFVEETKDYKNRSGHALGRIFGVKKIRFNSEDYGTVVVSTNVEQPAGTDHS